MIKNTINKHGLSCILCLVSFIFMGQTVVQQCKYRFDNYLNFKGSCNHRIEFQKEVIYILDSKGKKEFAIYASEIPMLAKFFANSSFAKQEKFIKFKGIKNLKATQRDSILAKLNDKKIIIRQNKLPLSGYRVAIDPGHSATNLMEAEIEQKFLYFVKDSINHPLDSVKLFESVLTFNTAQLLQKMLEEQGAKVLLTRSQNNFNSFNCTYTTWLTNHKDRVLDSLKNANVLPKAKYAKLMKMNDHDVFWEFFRDYELTNRAKVMNEFNPHASVIIHYNVDEKNEPWKQCSKKNFTMAFIGGAFTGDNLDKPENLVHFIRLLVTDELNQSEILASLTVNNFSNNLDIPKASQFDANYLKDNCLLPKSPGVFSRNLNLCRLVNSPLVYGESLYQDNEKECDALMKDDVNFKGIKTNDRLLNVAKSYYQAVLMFLKN
ncbi:MAG: N-acetylmuramoyl-L-alanine amidase [Bacteroidetes bacterium]|nr:N-acetylmuramoyl-L-alanine amidase [Bacteroidota bacterium]